MPSTSAIHATPLRLLFTLGLLAIVLPVLSSASFGSFVAQYSLPASFTPLAIAVGNSGRLYAVNTTTILAFASPADAHPTVVAPSTALVSASWMAAQPGSDLLLIADNQNHRFVFVNGVTGGSPYADLIEFNSPQSCGFINNNRVVLIDQLASPVADTADVSIVTIGQALATTFTASWPSSVGLLSGFTTDYADAYIVFSFDLGVVVYSSSGTNVHTYMATSDNSIAFLQATVASDAAGHLFLLQSTVIAQSNAQLIAVTATSGVLQADAQFGVVNGLPAAPLSIPINHGTGLASSNIAVDAAGQLYGVNNNVVQVFGGLVSGAPIPAPLTVSSAGFYLGQILADQRPGQSTPLLNPTSVAFDPITGDRYIVDNGYSRIEVQTASGTYIRGITGAYTSPAEVRVAGGLVYTSDPTLLGGTGSLYVQTTVGGAFATITQDDQGNLLSDVNFYSFDLDASGNILIPTATTTATGTATVRISALTNTGAPVPSASFDIGEVAGSDAVSAADLIGDFIVDRVHQIAYIAYTTGSIVGYSLAAATRGTVVSTFSSWGNNNPFTQSFGLALDAAGRLYIADFNQGVIVVNATTGAYITNFQGYYDTSADTNTNSVTIEPLTGRVFMTDDAFSRVVILQGFNAVAAFSSSSSTGSAAPSTVVSSSSGGSLIVGDPQFVGFRGQSFQVHGIDGHVYSLISEPTLQVNALFVFLTGGHCPLVTGRPSENCWTHPGSYIGAMSFQQRDNQSDAVHNVLVTAGSAETGLASVEVDGEDMLANGEVQVDVAGVTVVRLSAYEVRVTTPHFQFELINSDGFLNEAIRPLVSLKDVSPHGLLGQTWQSRKRIVEGEVEDYSISEKDMFGSDSMYDRFSHSTSPSTSP